VEGMIVVGVALLGVIGLGCAVLLPSIAYARFLVTGLLRGMISPDIVRFTALFLISIDATLLHSLYRFGFAKTEAHYPFFCPVTLCLLLILSSLAAGNLAVLLGRRIRFSPKVQAAAGVIALLAAAVAQAVFYGYIKR
jgi:hypothetical protein